MKIKILIKANYVFARELVRKHKLLFFFQFIIILLNSVNTVLSSYLPKVFLDMVQVRARLDWAIVWVLIYTIFFLLRNVINNSASIYLKYCYNRAKSKTKYHTDLHYQQLNDAFFDNPENLNICKRALSYAGIGGENFFNYIFSFLSNIIGIISLILVLTPFKWWISCFLTLMMLYRVVLEYKMSKKEFEFKKERTLTDRQIGYFSRLTNERGTLYDIRIYNLFDYFYNKFYGYFEYNTKCYVNHEKKMLFYKVLLQIPFVIQNLILYSYIGYQLYAGNVTSGDFTLFFAAVSNFNILLGNIKNSFTQLAPMCLEAQNYEDFMSVEEIYLLKNNNVVINEIQKIEFDKVSFKYPGKDFFILRDVSFKVYAHEKIQIVGVNGAGKTTIIKLLLGFYEPTQGEIKINDISLKHINLNSYWARIGTIFQQYNIYSMSAIENVVFDMSENKENFVKSVFSKLDLLQRFEKEPMGLKTELSKTFSERGTNLSGGEKQKISIARALCNYGEMLILDEPSSALDIISEDKFFNIINNSDKMVLCVYHKLKNSFKPDKILVLDNNKCLGYGDHSTLLNTCEKYRNLYNAQENKRSKE